MSSRKAKNISMNRIALTRFAMYIVSSPLLVGREKGGRT